MNKFVKSVAALAVACAVAISTAGCADITSVGTIDGENIRAGVYLMYELQAISEANSEIDDQLKELGQSASDIENFSYSNYNVQEKPYNQYVEERTMGYIKRHIAIQRHFAELGMELNDTEIAETKDSITEMWDTEMTYYGMYSLGQTYGEYYESLGISRASYQEVEMARMMNDKLFDHYYEENGVTPTDEQDIKTYYEDNYGRFQMIAVSLTEGDGSKIETDEGKQKMEELANGYFERLEDGEDYDTVYHDYEDFVAEQKAAAEEDSEDTSSDTSSETSEATAGDSTDVPEEEEDHDHETLLAKDSTSYDENMMKYLFDLKDDEGGVYKTDTTYYVVMRKKLLDRDDWFENNRSGILHLMKDEEFEGVLDGIAEKYATDFNNAALDAYKPDKIKQ